MQSSVPGGNLTVVGGALGSLLPDGTWLSFSGARSHTYTYTAGVMTGSTLTVNGKTKTFTYTYTAGLMTGSTESDWV